jgi:MFS family permease
MPQSSIRYAWYVASLLTLIQIVSYLDRFLPSLLAPAIKQDLHMTDFQIGLMLGPAFVIFYITLGIPIGWLADRFSRRTIIAAGVAIWCVMTALGAGARSFPVLFLTRLGVGIGEATVAPAAISLISDYFPYERRQRAIGLFMSGTFLGAGISFFVFGPVVHTILALPPVTIPLFGQINSWRLCFFLVGLPGLLLALMMPTVREPTRQDKVDTAFTGGGAEIPSLRQAAAFIGRRWRAFGTLFVASACTITMSALAFWNVALFKRTWDWNVAQVGLAVGIILLTAGPLGALTGIWLSNRWIVARRPDATLRVLFIGLLLSVPCSSIFSEMPSAALGLVFLFVTHFGQAMSTVSGPPTLMMLAPGQMRAQATAIYYFVISISSQLLGPPLVGAITDWFGDPAALRYAVSIEAIVVGLPSILLVWVGFGAVRRSVIELRERLAADAVTTSLAHGAA